MVDGGGGLESPNKMIQTENFRSIGIVPYIITWCVSLQDHIIKINN